MNWLISPAFFGLVDGVDTVRGLKNVLFARGVWLDFEDGDLSHAEFAKLFPRLEIVIFNTWSSTKAKPRWRAYLPISETITADVYAAITGEILKVIRDAGYPLPKRDVAKPHLKAHGIDLTKLKASDLFFLPCQPNDPSGAFFKHYRVQRPRSH